VCDEEIRHLVIELALGYMGELTNAQRALAESHCQECPICRAQHEIIHGMLPPRGSTTPLRVPSVLLANVRARIEARVSPRTKLIIALRCFGPLTAVAALTALLILTYPRAEMSVATSHPETTHLTSYRSDGSPHLDKGPLAAPRVHKNGQLSASVVHCPSSPRSAIELLQKRLDISTSHADLQRILDQANSLRETWPSSEPRDIPLKLAAQCYEKMGEMNKAYEAQLAYIDSSARRIAGQLRARGAGANRIEEAVANTVFFDLEQCIQQAMHRRDYLTATRYCDALAVRLPDTQHVQYALSRLAEAYGAMGDTRASIVAYRRLIQLQPESDLAYVAQNSLPMLHLNTGDLQAAVASSIRAAEMAPNDTERASSYLRVAQYYRAHGAEFYPLALRYCRKVRDDFPNTQGAALAETLVEHMTSDLGAFAPAGY